MLQIQKSEIQQGLWIEKQWLKEAGLNEKVQIVIQSGEIRIISTSDSISQQQEDAWDVFLSLEKDAPIGEVRDVSNNHDNYLYQK